ncbi:MAG: HD-GYP domain-containing protein, partial [Lachnospiraceae bacterium]|nr:HD-GYP domain-containing protein [Lachnospiraceae bacterium]
PYLEVDGERVYPDESGKFTIPSDTSKLTVPSFVFNYSLSDPLVSYMLEGFDTTNTTVLRSNLDPVDYTNLRGGNYSFVLQLKDAMGRGNKQIMVRIVKEKAIYEQIWFMVALVILSLLLVGLGVSLFFRGKLRRIQKKQEADREQFEQTAEALASAIDAKDRYTNGHSRRVAEYSLDIAKEAGLSAEECDQVYFAALLHDVGKIGVPIEILAKKGRLTDEEFEQIKMHPVTGGQILSSIRNSPWLSIGARYHHERYNGKGYPEGLSGNDIPKHARIIAVADAYDAMTSNRSYRNAIPQHIVREEIVKGIGTQFDPEYAKVMLKLIDRDTDYNMQEKENGVDIPSDILRCKSIYNDCSDGILIDKKATRLSFCSQPDDGVPDDQSLPSLILFDSLDGKVHEGEENNRNILYYEYAQIRMDGQIKEGSVRKTQVTTGERSASFEASNERDTMDGQRYEIYAVRYKDHAMVKIMDEERTISVILALPDTSRFLYISIGGENCRIHNIFITKDVAEIGTEGIPRIAEEISFIKDKPQGDIPNVQIDNWCSEFSRTVPLDQGLTLTFHSQSLPTARLVWNCPYICLFSSEDGQTKGKGFCRYMLFRIDGENWESDEHAENQMTVEKGSDFAGWKEWIELNKQGIYCTVKISREGKRIVMETENLNLAVRSVTTVLDDVDDFYIALTGDQCAITDIHISREG